MKTKEIQVGETYMLVATDDAKRQHLAGKPFTVSAPYYRHNWGNVKTGFCRSIKCFKNADGEIAYADELQPLPEAPVFAIGLRFFSRNFPGVIEITAVNEASGALSVKVQEADGDWNEHDDWPMEEIRCGFERGNYREAIEPVTVKK